MTERDTEDIIHDFDDLEPLELEPIEDGPDAIVADLEPIEESLEPLSEHPPVPDRIVAPEVVKEPESVEPPESPAVMAEPISPGSEMTSEQMEAPPEPPMIEPIPVPAAAASAAAPAAAAAPMKPGMVKASTGSIRERMEKDRESRKAPRSKKHGWERWTGPGEKPVRELEKAPLLLRKAAWWLIIGCMFPWGGVGAAWMWVVVEKLLIVAGMYTWHQAHLLRDGKKTAGYVQRLGGKSFKPLFVGVVLLTLVGFAPILSWGDHTAFAEKGFLILACLSFTHIYDYEHGGRFNPMYPLMFLAPGLGGLFALVKVFSETESINAGHLLAGVGAILVSIAGWMAAYTMYVALKEAKAEGDKKRAAQADARKAARATRRSS